VHFGEEDRRGWHVYPQQRLQRVFGMHHGQVSRRLPHIGGLPSRAELRENRRHDVLPVACRGILLASIAMRRDVRVRG
jgi:hypothetical protein